jgi:hypothetical protein
VLALCPAGAQNKIQFINVFLAAAAPNLGFFQARKKKAIQMRLFAYSDQDRH